MDKNWMQIKDKLHPAYEEGVNFFINFAYTNKDPNSTILCPCIKCNNFVDQNKITVERHLFVRGIKKSYTRWIHHGESFEEDYHDKVVDNIDEDSDEDKIPRLVNDLGTANFGDEWRTNNVEDSGNENYHVKKGTADRFLKLLDDAELELYPSCEFSKLSFIVNILHMKTMNRWSCKSIDMLLQLLKKSHPKGALVPGSYYEAKKIIRDLGLKCEKIHACENDCVLFWKEYENLDKCPKEKCKAPRYKFEGSKVPRKVLRYFPLKPRLQRFYVNKNVARDMRWHRDKRVNEENVMRHPADSQAWKEFDRKHVSFSQDPRNIRLGLASDGFNPFGNMSNAYSIWPVILVPYNLPPWMCMKDPFFILSMLIPGPKAPGNDIDVFLQPLVDELNELWVEGIETYDAYMKEKFKLHAALLWTINDFPAYGILSGWSNKGYNACPICMNDTTCTYLTNGRKCCYQGHRRFLPKDHRWRKEKKQFDGKQDFRDPIKQLSGDAVLRQLNSIEYIEFGKSSELIKDRKRKRRDINLNWTKKSIFFELPYWDTLELRHNLDIMHITKNVFDNLVGTLMDIEGKTKDNWKARKDLMEMGIKTELHLRLDGNSNSYVMPFACFNLSREEKRKICEFLSSIKYPDNFASNISRCVKTTGCHITGMKSHDCHVFLQRILPLALRGTALPKDLCQTLVDLSDFLKKLCSKTLYLDDLEKLEKNIPIILCKLERVFPPSFFDIMVHLLVHLPMEARIAGPVQYRWMFPFERKMATYKGYVNNKARPEGCIVERYIDDECLTFSSMYLGKIETRFNRVERNFDRGDLSEELFIFSSNGRPFGQPIYDVLSDADLKKVHIYVLKNCEEIESYKEELKQRLGNVVNIDQVVDLEFPDWFRHCVRSKQDCNKDLVSLARGPDSRVRRYKGCNVNGLRFHTRDREQNRKTQNSGVVVKGEHNGKIIDFYGVLVDIIEVDYLLGQKQVLLFKCDWWNVGDSSGLKIDKEWKVTSVNMSKKWYLDQPFVLASQVEQVFYLKDMKLGNNWFIVEKVQPRGSYDVPEQDVGAEDNDEPYQEEELDEVSDVIETNGVASLERENMEPIRCPEASFSSTKGFISMEDDHDENVMDDDDEEIYTDEQNSSEEEMMIDSDSESDY